MKLETLIVSPKGVVLKKISNILYNPIQFIKINDVEWEEWGVHDTFEDDTLVRTILLRY